MMTMMMIRLMILMIFYHALQMLIISTCFYGKHTNTHMPTHTHLDLLLHKFWSSIAVLEPAFPMHWFSFSAQIEKARKRRREEVMKRKRGGKRWFKYPRPSASVPRHCLIDRNCMKNKKSQTTRTATTTTSATTIRLASKNGQQRS